MHIKKLLEHNALFIAISLTIFVALISLVSLKEIPSIGGSNSDKVGHVIAYFVLCLSWLNANDNFFSKRYQNYKIIFILIVYGIIIEGLQHVLTTYRQADLYDVFANSLGVLLALILFKSIHRKF
mgnify:CR=1 FL=1